MCFWKTVTSICRFWSCLLRSWHCLQMPFTLNATNQKSLWKLLSNFSMINKTNFVMDNSLAYSLSVLLTSIINCYTTVTTQIILSEEKLLILVFLTHWDLSWCYLFIEVLVSVRPPNASRRKYGCSFCYEFRRNSAVMDTLLFVVFGVFWVFSSAPLLYHPCSPCSWKDILSLLRLAFSCSMSMLG
jgi:hypothetical protein